MTEKNAIIPHPDRPDSLSAETLMLAGDILSKSLLFALGRDYLGSPAEKQNFIRLLPGVIPQQQDLAFLELEQVGKPVDASVHDYFRSIQTTLAACHDPRYTLLFAISSDGLRNRIFLGVRARVADAQATLFAAQLGQFLCSNWPGTRIRPVTEYKHIVDTIHVPLSSYRYARSFTGIPSAKVGDRPEEYPQSLDRFMRGLRGKPYLYLVIANPMAEDEVNGIITACHTLSSQVHAFTKSTIQRSSSTGTSETTTLTEGDTTTTGTIRGTTESKSDNVSKGALGTAFDKSKGKGKVLKGAGLTGLSGLLFAAGGPFLLSGMLGMFGMLLPSTGTSASTSTSSSDSDSRSSSTSQSGSTGTTSGESLSFGQEYLNKHAEACEKLLEKTATRFEIAKAQGCWNVGVYLVCNQSEAAAQGQAQFKALVSGEKSTSEPIRAHDLAHLWDGQIQTSLDTFQHPPLRLFAPQSGEQIHHPFGEAFENLTTPLNTEELSLLANLPMREMPGMPMQPSAFFSLNPPKIKDSASALRLGTLLEGGEDVADLNYEVDINTLTRHVFITGITGSGKSNTCRRLLTSLMETGRNFLVIEPAKDEYVQLALAYNQSGTFDKKIAVYVPGRTEWGNQPLDELHP